MSKSAKNIERVEKRVIAEKQKVIKPGECLKYIKIIIDPEIMNGSYGSQIINNLNEIEVQFEVKAQLLPMIVSWQRKMQQTFTTNNGLSDKNVEENHILYIMFGQDVIQSIKNKTLLVKIKNVQEIYPDKIITLFVFGLRDYCRKEKQNLGRIEIETSLTELQLFANCSHRLLETATELGTALVQYTKSISEILLKQQQNEKFDGENIFFSNDNRDCVKIQNSIGLSRLWQQHFTKLPLVTLETAQAITNAYPMPRLLLNAYEASENPTNLLSDIQVRRAGGPLTSVRRVGPELSKKINLLYTSTNPEDIL